MGDMEAREAMGVERLCQETFGPCTCASKGTWAKVMAVGELGAQHGEGARHTHHLVQVTSQGVHRVCDPVCGLQLPFQALHLHQPRS